MTLCGIPIEVQNVLGRFEEQIWLLTLSLDMECFRAGYRTPESKLDPSKLRKAV